MDQNRSTNTLPVVISLIVGLIIGYIFGTLSAGTNISTEIQEISDRTEAGFQENTAEFRENREADEAAENAAASDPNADQVAFTIPMNSLSSEQQVIVRGMGIEGDSIAITRGMVTCAEVEIGSERMVEIQNGGAVSMSEGMQLIGCYRDGSNS